MSHLLRRHPKTGAPLAPVYVTKHGVPRYPILGASEDDGDAGGDGSDGEDGDGPGEEQPEFTRTDLTNRLQREKRQGQAALARKLGFDSVKDLEDHIASVKQAEEAQLTEVQRREKAAEEARAAAQREAAETAAERHVARLERALVRRGVTDDDLEDAVALLERNVSSGADADAIAEAADALKDRRKELFGGSAGGDDGEGGRRPAGGFPGGSGPKKRNDPPGKDPGAYGRQRAERRWGTTS